MDPVKTRGWKAPALVLGLMAAAAGVGCTGAINNDTAPGPGGGMQPGGGGNQPGGGGMQPAGGMGTPGPTVVAPGSVSVGVSPLRRLTSDEYRSTVRDLLGISDARDLIQANALPSDDSIVDRFNSNTVAGLQGLDADKYADAAELLARKAAMNLPALTSCDTKVTGEMACATQFIKSFGKRAFRRPVADTEVARYQKVYAAGGSWANGIRMVVQAFLQSPKFLYLVEPVPADAGGKVLAVDSWVMASRLSYFLLGSMPDEPLFAAAEANQLATAQQVADQARRLLNDPRFGETVGLFHDQWLELDNVLGADKDPALFPMWNDVLKAALDEQTRRFVDNAVRQDGRLETLLSGNSTFVSGPLYDLYGLPKPAGAALTTWQKVDLDKSQRAGVLTQAGFLAGLAHENRTSFILRGKLVREALLCRQVPPPPPGVDASEMNIPPSATAKQRSEAHRKDPLCASCHSLFDPLGFAFEGYDAVGRYRPTDASGAAVDTSVTVTDVKSINGTFANAVELAGKLASAEEVRDCVVRQWARFGLGRLESEKDDAASVASAMKAFTDSGGKFPELLIALARSDAFRHQKVSQ